MAADELGGLDWDKGDGLLPAIVLHADSGQLLMHGYMNRAALRTTQETGRVTFFSRLRDQLWTKGESSGNTLEAVRLSADCDGDAILVLGRPQGPVCHTGADSCFPGAGRSEAGAFGILAAIEQSLAARLRAQPAGSYAGQQAADGAALTRRLGAATAALARADGSGDRRDVVAGAADLLSALTRFLLRHGTSLTDVIAELERRETEIEPGPPPSAGPA